MQLAHCTVAAGQPFIPSSMLTVRRQTSSVPGQRRASAPAWRSTASVPGSAWLPSTCTASTLRVEGEAGEMCDVGEHVGSSQQVCVIARAAAAAVAAGVTAAATAPSPTVKPPLQAVLTMQQRAIQLTGARSGLRAGRIPAQRPTAAEGIPGRSGGCPRPHSCPPRGNGGQTRPRNCNGIGCTRGANSAMQPSSWWH